MTLPTAVTFYEVSVAVHVMAVVVALGPTFAYPIAQLAAEKAFPQHLPFALRMIHATDKAIVNPGAVLIGITGIYQAIEGPFDFGEDHWMSIGLGLYLLVFATGLWVFRPSVIDRAATAAEKMVAQSPPGGPVAKTDEYNQIMRVPNMTGPVLGILTLIIIYLMVIKPF